MRIKSIKQGIHNKGYFKSETSKNILTLMTGTTIAQAIPIAISPILTRLYTPADFGMLGLFIAITSILGVVANARYELAIMLPEEKDDAISLVVLGFIISSSVSSFLFILVALFHEYFALKLGSKAIEPWLYFVPVTVFFSGLYNVLNYYNLRLKNYNAVAISKVHRTMSGASVSLLHGLFLTGGAGLILAQVFNNFAGIPLLFNKYSENANSRAEVSIRKLLENTKRYRRFPMFTLPAGLMNVLSTHLVNILISAFYSISILGSYSLVQRILNLPLQLISDSIGQNYFERASSEYQNHDNFATTFKHTVFHLFMVAIIIFPIIYLSIEDAVVFIFGERWCDAGKYAKIMVPLFAIRFIVAPISISNIINKHNVLGLIWQGALLILSVSILLLSAYYKLEFKTMLELMIGFLFFHYVLFLVLIYRHVVLIRK
jgi:O-antigen/teichoic acid export membrane protein